MNIQNAMLTLQNRPAGVRLQMRGTSHYQPSQLSAVEDTFRDQIDIRFEIGSQRSGQANTVTVKETSSPSRPGFTAVQGVVMDRARPFGVGAWVTPPDENGTREYQGQIQNDQIFLSQTSPSKGYYQVSGRVGTENVDFTVRSFSGRMDIDGQVGRHAVHLDGYEQSGMEAIPLAGIVTSLAASAYIQRY